MAIPHTYRTGTTSVRCVVAVATTAPEQTVCVKSPVVGARRRACSSGGHIVVTGLGVTDRRSGRQGVAPVSGVGVPWVLPGADRGSISGWLYDVADARLRARMLLWLCLGLLPR